VGTGLLLPLSGADAAPTPWSNPVPAWAVNLDAFDLNTPIAQSSPVLATMRSSSG
jgi:hypothetical protein